MNADDWLGIVILALFIAVMFSVFFEDDGP